MEILLNFCVTSGKLSKCLYNLLGIPREVSFCPVKENFMKRIFSTLLTGSFVLAAILALSSPPLLAHHGRGATYAKTDLSLKGTVKEVLWRNPHIAICLCLPHHSLSSNAEDGGSVRQSNR